MLSLLSTRLVSNVTSIFIKLDTFDLLILFFSWECSWPLNLSDEGWVINAFNLVPASPSHHDKTNNIPSIYNAIFNCICLNLGRTRNVRCVLWTIAFLIISQWMWENSVETVEGWKDIMNRWMNGCFGNLSGNFFWFYEAELWEILPLSSVAQNQPYGKNIIFFKTLIYSIFSLNVYSKGILRWLMYVTFLLSPLTIITRCFLINKW